MEDMKNSKDGSKAKVGDSNPSSSGCPFLNGDMKGAAGSGLNNRDWWPNSLKYKYT